MFLNLFLTSSQVHNYGIRTASRYRSHSCRTNLKQCTILYQGPKIWFSLPVSLLLHLVFSPLRKKWGSRDGAVVRALASHQCGPGSILSLGVICGLSLLLVLVLAPRGFSPGTPVFPSPQKPTLLNSNLIWKVSPISALR